MNKDRAGKDWAEKDRSGKTGKEKTVRENTGGKSPSTTTTPKEVVTSNRCQKYHDNIIKYVWPLLLILQYWPTYYRLCQNLDFSLKKGI